MIFILTAVFYVTKLRMLFDKENIALPQDVVINITATPWSEIKDIPSDCVIADDGLITPAH